MSRSFLGDAARWALIAVFVASAASKAIRRIPRMDQAAELQRLGIPRSAAPALVVGLPIVEFGLAVVLLFLPGRFSALLAAAFLVAATLVLIRAVATGTHEPCRCFGTFSARPVSGITLTRNAALLGLAALAWWAPVLTTQDPIAGALGIAIGFALMFLG